MLADTGEVLDDVTSVVHSPEGLRQLVNLPAGSAEAELGLLLLQVQLYHYLETTRHWNVLGADIMKSSADLKEKIRQGKKIGGSVEGRLYIRRPPIINQSRKDAESAHQK